MNMKPDNPDTAKWFVDVPDNPIKRRCICCNVLVSAVGVGQFKHVNLSETHRLNHRIYELQEENERLKSVSIEVFREHVEEQKQPLLEEIERLKERNEYNRARLDTQRDLIDNLKQQKLKAERNLATIRNQHGLDLKAYIDENEKLKNRINNIRAFT